MSEFSESFHLLADGQAAGVALLERAGLAGWVYRPANGWVTVVLDRDFSGEGDPALIEANEGVLLLYVNAEDHGWSLTVWEGSTERSAYEAEWTEEMSTKTRKLDLNEVKRLLAPAIGEESAHRLMELLRAPLAESDWDSWIADGNPGHRAARLLRLEHADWLSGMYLAAEPSAAADDGAVRVDTR